MKNLIRLLALAALTAAFFGCASGSNLYSEIEDQQIAPEPGKALVYFYRSTKYAALAKVAIYDWEQMIGFMPTGYKMPYQAEPGEHTFMAVGEAADFCGADLIAGKTYYIKVAPRMGAWTARFSLDPVEKETYSNPDFTGWVAKAPVVEPTQDAFDWHEAHYKSVDDKRADYFAVWEPKEDKPFLAPEDHE